MPGWYAPPRLLLQWRRGHHHPPESLLVSPLVDWARLPTRNKLDNCLRCQVARTTPAIRLTRPPSGESCPENVTCPLRLRRPSESRQASFHARRVSELRLAASQRWLVLALNPLEPAELSRLRDLTLGCYAEILAPPRGGLAVTIPKVSSRTALCFGI